MNRDRCRTVALNLLESVGDGLDDAENVESLLTLLIDVTRASVYATLASTELTPMPKPGPRVCGCPFLPDPHIWGASCPRPAAEQVAAADRARAERVLPPGYRPQYAAGGPVPSDGPGQ
jgi:hypothetical protein